jgi:hypothetical protein
MEESSKQVLFRCSEEFFKRIEHEKTSRNLTTQDMVIRALERYFAVPERVHAEIEQRAAASGKPISALLWYALTSPLLKRRFRPEEIIAGETKTPAEGTKAPFLTADQVQNLRLATTLFELVQQLPPEKVRLLLESLALDVKYYRSSRITAGSRITTKKSEGAAE